MIKLKCTKFINLNISPATELDMQVRQYKDQSRYIYLGQGSQVIQFREDDIDKIYEFLKKAKDLELESISVGFIK